MKVDLEVVYITTTSFRVTLKCHLGMLLKKPNFLLVQQKKVSVSELVSNIY